MLLVHNMPNQSQNPFDLSALGGTLTVWLWYGTGNPRFFVSGWIASLLKFNLLKLKGCSLKSH